MCQEAKANPALKRPKRDNDKIVLSIKNLIYVGELLKQCSSVMDKLSFLIQK